MFADDFFAMEEKHRLFELRAGEDVPLWDLVRMYVYLKYYFPETKQPAEVSSKSIVGYFNFFAGLISTLWYFIFKKADYFFLPVSRTKGSDGRYFDKAAASAIEAIGSKAFVFEMRSVDKKYRYSSANNYFEYYKRFSKRSFTIPPAVFNHIEQALQSTFGECRVTTRQLNSILQTFHQELKFFKAIFRFKKVRQVFITNNGYRKGLVKAARELTIPVYEFQHGSFERDHLAYAYPAGVQPGKDVLLPDHLLTFGEYWGAGFNVPIANKLAIGNDFFCSANTSTAGNGSILFVSSKIHGKDLFEVAKSVASQFTGRQINFKLHPNEFSEADFYIRELRHFSNVSVCQSESDITELISQADLVVLIASTALYEALNQQKKVAIYKRVNYSGSENLFHLPNVYLFDDSSEIESILQAPVAQLQHRFFKSFDRQLFQSLLKTHS